MTAPRKRPKAAATSAPLSGPLRAAVAARGVSAYALGRAAGVDPRNVRRWLVGETDLSLGSADRVAVALGVRASEGPARKGATRQAPVRPATPLPFVETDHEPEPEAEGS